MAHQPRNLKKQPRNGSNSANHYMNIFRTIIKNIGVLILITTPVLGYLGVSYVIQATMPIDKEPYVHWNGLDPQESVYITWETSDESASYVEYGTTPASLSSAELNSSLSTLHRIRLDGLSAGTRYYYRVGGGSGDLTSEVQRFDTAPTTDGAFNVTLISDTQQFMGTGHYDLISDAIGSKRHGDASFLINAGDLGQEYDNQATWNLFMRAGERFTGRIPMVPCLGNHDISRTGEGGCANLYTKYYNMSRGGCGGYYAFNWSNTMFAVLQIAEGGDENPDTPFAIEHDTWLNQTLENAQDKAYRILIFHRQLYSSIGNSETNINRLTPIIEKYNVSLVFYGHKHCYERFLVNGKSYICLGGGGGMQNTISYEYDYTRKIALGPSFTRLFINDDGITLKTLSPNFDIMDQAIFDRSGSKLILTEES